MASWQSSFEKIFKILGGEPFRRQTLMYGIDREWAKRNEFIEVQKAPAAKEDCERLGQSAPGTRASGTRRWTGPSLYMHGR